MWYELEMIEEHFSSLRTAIHQASWPIDIFVHCNKQTYIETPDDPAVMNRFMLYIEQWVAPLKNVTITVSTMDEPFYSHADFRRLRSYGIEKGYNIQGEIDSVLPEVYFIALEAAYDALPDTPHIISFSSRKMWDATWLPVEHFSFQHTPREKIQPPFDNEHYITEQQLNEFNRQYNPFIVQLAELKIDGCLLAIRDGVPVSHPESVHFGPDDFIAQHVLALHGVPQYHFSTILKGHNYRHPKKRTGTDSTRDDEIYKKYYTEAFDAGRKYVHELQTTLQHA